MKKWGFLNLFLVCMCIVFINNDSFFESIVDLPGVEVQEYENDKVEDSMTDNIQEITITEEQIFQGNLLLVNSEYPVRQAGIKSDVVNLFTHNELVKGYGLLYNDTYLLEYVISGDNMGGVMVTVNESIK
nr:hypothetical protein [Ornithinibacillus scapharcae]